MADKTPNLEVLCVGIDPISRGVIDGFVSAKAKVIDAPYDLEKLMEPLPNPPCMIFCGPPPEGVALNEVAQMFRMNYQEQGIFFVTTVRKGFERKDFQKNGFSDAFLLPIEVDVFRSAVEGELSRASKGVIKTYRTVRMVDISPDTVLDFDTYMYMPVNKKNIKISAAGDALDKARAEKLAKHNVNSINITQDQISKFYQFTAKRLKDLNSGTGVSQTEKRERMNGAIRSLISGMFNDSDATGTTDQGRAMAKDCQEIVKAYVIESDSKAGWYDKLLSVTGEQAGAYNHTANVATYAALFSLGLGIGKPEELAMAGLLHDIGLADVPPAIQLKEASERTKEEQEITKSIPSTQSASS